MQLIAADSSSLILLTRIDLMAIVLEEFQVIIPERVYQECVNEESKHYKPGKCGECVSSSGKGIKDMFGGCVTVEDKDCK